MMNYINKKFLIEEKSTNIKTEIIAGLTTFLTMAYIIVVNPQMMADAGMNYGASFVGTCLAAAIACFVMGFYANWPVGLAPGMGLNAFFTYTVVGEMGYNWEIALGAVFLSGLLFFLISITRLRAWLLNNIPNNMRISMGVGVGLFIGFVGLRMGGIISPNEATYLGLGDIKNTETVLACFGFIIIAALSIRKTPGAILIGILLITLLAFFMGRVEFNGFISTPPSLAPIFLKLDIIGAFDVAMISVVMSFLFVNFFDTTGTLLGVANQTKLTDASGNTYNLKQALNADSSSSFIGTFFGCSPVTSYIESISGVEAGGKTGLTALVVSVLFLLATFLSPIASIIPPYATAGALIYVSMLMFFAIRLFDWSDITEVIPCLLTIIIIPLTFSIANGIALGFISYILIKILTGKSSDLNLGVISLGVIFGLKFLFL